MYWHQIKNIAGEHSVLHMTESSPDTDYGNASILSKLERMPTSATLYFIHLSNLPEVLEWLTEHVNTSGRLSLIIFADVNFLPEIIDTNYLENVIVLSTSEDYSDVYLEVLELLDQERAIEYDFRILIGKLQKNLPVDRICTEVTATLHRIPTALLDTVMTPISISSGDPLSQIVSQALNTSDALISKIGRIISSPVSSPTALDQVSLDPDTVVHLTILPIRSGALRIGYLVVFVPKDKHLSDLDIQYLGHISNILSTYLQKNAFSMLGSGEQTSILLSTCFEDRTRDMKKLKKQFSLLGYTLHDHMRVLVIRPNDAVASYPDLSLLGKTCTQTFSNSIFMIQDQAVVLLMSTQEEWELSEPLARTYQSFAVRNGVSIGLSSSFIDLRFLPQKRMEARSALSVGQKYYPNVFFFIYDRLRIHYEMELLLEMRQADMTAFLYPPLMKLLQYDADHNSRLTYTLYLFLNYPKDPRFVCETLGIHKNTLYSRLRKIEEYIPDELLNMNTISQIYTTLLLVCRNNRLYFSLTLPDNPIEGNELL